MISWLIDHQSLVAWLAVGVLFAAGLGAFFWAKNGDHEDSRF